MGAILDLLYSLFVEEDGLMQVAFADGGLRIAHSFGARRACESDLPHPMAERCWPILCMASELDTLEALMGSSVVRIRRCRIKSWLGGWVCHLM